MTMDSKIREAQQDDKDGIDGADNRLRRLKTERTSLRVTEFKVRVEARPADAGLRFRLGQYLLEANELDEAIAELQLAVKDPRRKYEAMALLGQAFLKQGMADLATRQLKGALDGLGGPGDKTLGLLYLLGQAAESASDTAGALEWYGSIYEIKAGYRDTADRMARLRE
jgi:tetratricopeptide (TPR) repeat protein